MLISHEAANNPSLLNSEPAYGDYFAGLTRRIERGTRVHIDFAPGEHPTWEVAQVISQLSWNLYLELTELDQGKTHIYNRLWQPEDEVLRNEAAYGYQETIVEGAQHVTFQPRVGDVVIFNTCHFHQVEPVDGYRVTFTSALGLYPSGEIIFGPDPSRNDNPLQAKAISGTGGLSNGKCSRSTQRRSDCVYC